MTDQELDRMLRRALLDAADQEAQTPPETEVPLSEGHRRRMREMLRDPLLWFRLRNPYPWRTVVRRAAVVLLIAFTAAMELLPRLTLRGDDALAVAEAEYRAMCAFDKYGSGVWPAGTYVERYGGGEATVRVEPYRQYNDVQLITIEVRIDGSRKRIVHRQLVECAE